MGKQVAIVGGGLAGLAAAAGLAGVDCNVTLLESRPRLGGRAGSFLDNETGAWIDTCQHVAMGCCTNFNHFCRLVGIDDLFAEQPELLFIGPGGERCPFRDRPVPAPLHLLAAFSALRYFSRRQRIRLCRDVARLAHRRWGKETGLSFQQWLQRHSQTADLQEPFWDVILVSALSETADRIAVPHARKVFVDGFLAHRDGWRVRIPAVPLNELYSRRLTGWLTSRGVNVRTQAGVVRLQESDGRITSVPLRSGEVFDADEFIVAVPWHRAGELLPAAVVQHDYFAGVKSLESAPIASVHLWFDRPVLDRPHAVLVGRLSQWVFRRVSDPQVSIQNPGNGDYLQVVISASRNIAGRSQTSVIDDVVRELSGVWPAVRTAELLTGRVVTEHRAVFSPLPGVEALRPDQQSPIPNLQLAGDWTNTGWPATMESAVKSGFLAAENVLHRLGTPRSLVQPGLKPAWLARILLGISTRDANRMHSSMRQP